MVALVHDHDLLVPMRAAGGSGLEHRRGDHPLLERVLTLKRLGHRLGGEGRRCRPPGTRWSG
eukprot:1603591-Pyramimonas_sp.AAC.1